LFFLLHASSAKLNSDRCHWSSIRGVDPCSTLAILHLCTAQLSTGDG